MEIELRKIVTALIAIAMFASAFAGTASALGMLNLDFGNVEQGRTYTETVNVITSEMDFDNRFIIEKSGELAEWIDVSPMEFDLKAGDTQTLTVMLTVPEDAKLGEYTGAITVVGQRTAPAPGATPDGAAVGYTVATKSNLHANVIKPGAVEAVSILSVIAPERVDPGSVAKFDVSIKNTGNIPTTASPTLTVSKGTETVATIPGVPVELNVDEEKTAKLYWDAQEKGTYTAVVAVTCGETITESEPISIEVSKGGFSIPSVSAFGVVASILAAFAFALLRRKR
ncbi:MAG TPA: hypothetical protein EYP28_00665 [Methanophagales archaeon]|nr:hypothetical protein [Methanophagales archaeon]